jgi:hypothetical protein
MTITQLEDTLTLVADILAVGRDAEWDLYDLTAAALDGLDRASAKVVRGQIASVAGRSAATVAGWARMATTYPVGTRYAELPMSVFRAALRADNPAALVRRACDEQWTATMVREHLRGQRAKRRQCVFDASFTDSDLNTWAEATRIKMLDLLPARGRRITVRIYTEE